jgi:hypothetical protein
MFSQDMAIFVRSRGINSKYAFKKKYRVNILVFYFLFLVHYSFWSAYALLHVLYAISENQKQSGKCFIFYVCSLFFALCKLNKSETERKLAFSKKAN